MKRRLRPGPDHPVRTGRPSPVRQPEEQEREKGEAGKNDSWQTPDADYGRSNPIARQAENCTFTRLYLPG